MNYLRGAVNAISAPYQYYKELPPINPSTLTGAIDVIVIQRPADNGDTELACSPFHVRFGKWQVLRPSEKKVNVAVNGHPIPYNMKIGEAGEAFFVFETEDDVPDSLITSPILQPTHPDGEAASPEDVPSERFGAKEEPKDDQEPPADEEGRIHTKNEEEIHREDHNTQEPEFLDLDATASMQNTDQREGEQPHDDDAPQEHHTPKQLPATPELGKKPSQISLSQPALSLPSPPPSRDQSRSRTPEMDNQDKRVDEALKALRDINDAPEVEYHHDITLDIEGYHSHSRERTDETIRSGEFRFPERRKSSSRPSTPSPQPSDSHYPTLSKISDSPVSFPAFRATSEPPPHLEDHDALPTSKASSSKLQLPSQQEYSWEWGNFPQPSPLKMTFGTEEGLDLWGKKGKGKASGLKLDQEEHSDSELRIHDTRKMPLLGVDDADLVRSHSVPPELEGSHVNIIKPGSRKVREHTLSLNKSTATNQSFGAGGRLSAKRNDPSRFLLNIEGNKVVFELGLINVGEKEHRGRKSRDSTSGGSVFGSKDEVEASEVFNKHKVTFEQFLFDDSIVRDPGLVIRWAEERYISRNDGSPLMDSLIHWREAALQYRENAALPSRPVSPMSDDEERPPTPSSLSATEELKEDEATQSRKKPTSSSWVQWWSRSRRQDNEAKNKGDRPELRGTASEPLASEPALSTVPAVEKVGKSQSYNTQMLKEVESALALSSTAVKERIAPKGKPSPTGTITQDQATPVRTKKFAKTLRLTSDQLKALNLKLGANTITFSLSASGVPAATARIFVWDYSDSVVVSDIDGTITKSDGLGHVFAMIGRDWTHLGVAKLYTDITRNGYKIMYLTSRAIGQADATRDYLKGIKQNDYQLPEGPVIMSPDRLMASLHREVIMRKPEVFKMACLRDIRRLFGESAKNPFYAGFGNRITDALSYRSVDIPSAKIFTIDSAGEVKMELLELAGYKSSYIHMTDLVDQMFPPIHRKWTPEFTDFNYWKAPIQDFPLPDLSPPSPALSARSDTSNQSTFARLRNFSLVGSRQSSMSIPVDNLNSNEGGVYRSSHLRQLSSLEKLSTTLGFMSTVNDIRRSVSPDSRSSSYADSDDEDSEELSSDVDGRKRRRERRRSMTSMPGSLDDMNFDDLEEEEGEHECEEEVEVHEDEPIDEEAAAEEAFDEDFAAAGEMQNVPFI
ncbi:Lipin/Ned1/Smp2-domain-containing protein [Cyathus striatus]|nr:Lipin/Ned1/Smp2-domain-containing protein [Cyathus striatus]